jgi:hypothetical protein
MPPKEQHIKYDIVVHSQVVFPGFSHVISSSDIHQKLTEFGIINAQGKIQGDKIENPAILTAVIRFLNGCDEEGVVSGRAKRIFDMIHKKYDTYYLNEFNEYHWVRHLNSFEVPKTSDQQLVNQTDTLSRNTGQEIFDRLLASTILVRSDTDDTIIINNPEDIKPDVFRVLKDDYGVEFAMAIAMDLDNNLNRLNKEGLHNNSAPTPPPPTPPIYARGNAGDLRMSRKLLIMLAAAALGATVNSR